MIVLRTADDLERLDRLRAGGELTVVPTMGALHDGHLDLVAKASVFGPVVVTIFVNPTQFGPGEDFTSYPRDLEHDLDLLAPLAPAAVFAPDNATVYGDGRGVTVHPGRFAEGLCGGLRPGHFAGVLTVVARLFGLVRPDVAVFGRKDAQQCLVIDEMVRDLGLPVRLVDAPTVREPDGLAMSSRNRYLSATERKRALALSEGLAAAREALAGGERSTAALTTLMEDKLALTDGCEYAVVRRLVDWSEPTEASGVLLLAVAARLGAARLIDNLVLDVTGDNVVERGLLGQGENT